MKIFLTIEHWLFILIIVACFIAAQVVIGASTKFFVVICLWVLVLGWFYTAGNYLRKKAAPKQSIGYSFFRGHMLATGALLLMSLIQALMPYKLIAFLGMTKIWGLILVLALLSILTSFLHSIWFVARTLKMVEKGRKVYIEDYLLYLLALFFFMPIGILAIQPKLNRMVREDEKLA